VAVDAGVGPEVAKGRSYWTYASFRDPDGNGWLLQEITARLPGREWDADTDVASRAGLLRETAEYHGKFEAVAPPHGWWDWYAAYMLARETGRNPDQASADAGRYMAQIKHGVVSPLDAGTGRRAGDLIDLARSPLRHAARRGGGH
jgi:hypothetical protein